MRTYLFQFAALFMFISIAAGRPTTALFAKDLGASVFLVGLMNTCYALLPFFLAIYAGRFVDRVGEKLPIILGTIGMSLAFLLPFLKPSLITLFYSQVILGGTQLLAQVALQNGVAGSALAIKRDQAVATFTLFISAGSMLGPLLGGYSITHLGFRYTYLIIALFPLVSTLLALAIKSAIKDSNQPKEVTKSLDIRELLSIPGLKRIIFVGMLNLAAVDIFFVYYPLYCNSIGLDPSQIGILISIQAMSSIVVRFFIPRLVKQFGRVNIITFFMLVAGIAYGSIPVSEVFFINALIAAILGLGLGITQPLTTILAYNSAPTGRTGEVLGIRLAGNRLSEIVIPLVLGGISTLTGLGAVFIIQAFLLSVGSLLSRGIKQDN